VNRIAITALVRNDLRLYFTDRRAVIVGLLVPVMLAAFFGYIFNSTAQGSRQDAGKVPIAVVDEDGSPVSLAITADLAADGMLDVATLTRAEAIAAVRKGTRQVAAIFPKDFGTQSVAALFSGKDKPGLQLLVDPSQAMSARLAEGLLAQYAMRDISREAFAGVTGRNAMDGYLAQLDQAESTPARRELQDLLRSVKRLNQLQTDDRAAAAAGATAAAGSAAGFELSIPYQLESTPATAARAPYNSFAHSFAGMSVQFILFAGIDAGILLLLLRQGGIWQRIRSAPLTRAEFILARILATTLISAFQLTVIYGVALTVFGVRISGSPAGFAVVAIAFCLLNAAFGLMLATIGRSTGATRGIAILVMLLLVMAGGAWVPSFIFPQWLQQLSLATPTRWAVDGLDAMTWRGLPFGDAVMPAIVLCAFALLCGAVALWRFRWEE
jgi:ABC-2 type transport system permease protein